MTLANDPLLVTGKTAKLPGDYAPKPAEKAKVKSRDKTDLRHEFANIWVHLGNGERGIMEYRFHPVRRWRFDVAFPASRVAVELEGGIWVEGGHSRGSGVVKDIEKYNSATLLGWRILRYTSDDLRKRPGEVCDEVRSLLVRPAAE